MARAKSYSPGFFGAKRIAFPHRRLKALPRRTLVPAWWIKEQRRTMAKARRAVMKTAKPSSNKITPEQRLVQRITSGMTVVPGFVNKLNVFMMRFMPRWLSTRLFGTAVRRLATHN